MCFEGICNSKAYYCLSGKFSRVDFIMITFCTVSDYSYVILKTSAGQVPRELGLSPEGHPSRITTQVTRDKHVFSKNIYLDLF